MQQSVSRTSGFSIPVPASRQLALVGKKGPAFTGTCPDCDDFQTVVRRDAQLTTVSCSCQLAAAS
ncbi:hypothetical protein [Streptomyces sp. NPDC005408]|uniref:hypothetical protein n=1 Tax=Streptomyces sp. NPDC005408 TaxID=3155341 RepID=UPI0033A22A96